MYLVENLCREIKHWILVSIIVGVCSMDYLLYDSETRYFGILVFEFLMDNTVVCFILNFTCGKLILFVMIVLSVLILIIWSLILQVIFGKGTLPCTKLYIFILLCMEYK